MNIDEILKHAGGLGDIAKQLGLSEQQASAGANALLPGLISAFQQQAGNADLGSLLGKIDLGSLAGQFFGQSNNAQNSPLGLGNDILGHILGNKDASRSLAQSAAAESGLDISQLKAMLPMLATLVAGFLGSKGGAAGLQSMLQGQLGNVLGGALKKFF